MNKLLNKKGSVLFLVIVVMSILIVAASATFFIINNQHSSVTVRYSSEQSYQTAFSVSTTVSNYIDGYLEAIGKSGKEMDEWGNTLIAKMLKMPSNTSSNVTSEFDLSSIGMGKADVVITKKIVKNDPVNPENFIHVFEITTTSEFNGETVSVTQVKEISTGPTEYFTRFLTSTGKRPEDVLFSSHSILSEAYFENDYTRLGGGIAPTHLNHSLYSLGTIYDDGITYKAGESKEIVVAQSYYITSTGGGSLYADEMYIGGDLINGENGDFNKTKAIYADNVYVLRNMEIGSNGVTDGVGTTYYVNGDCHIWCGTEHSKFYINGDLYLHNTGNNQGQFYVKGNVIIADAYGNGMGWSLAEGIEYGKDVIMSDGSAVDETSTQYTNKHFVHSPSMGAPFDDAKVTDVKNHINSSTKKNKYQVWDAEKYFNDTFNPSGTLSSIRLDDTDDSHVSLMLDSFDNPKWDSYIVKLDESCIIQPAENWQSGNHLIIIDTSVYDKDIYVYLQPKTGSNTFSFALNPSAEFVNVLIKGKHSVIFVLPANVNFVMTGHTFIGHVDVLSSLSNTGYSSDNFLEGVPPNDYFTELRYLQNNGSRLENSLYLDSDDGATKFKAGAFSGDAHNNIFLVSKGTNNSIDFSAESTFLGYVYAPSAIMTANGAAAGLGFIGGLIVGSYTYQTNAALAFTTPYDYHSCYPISKGTDIVKYLINFANAGGVGSPSGGDSATLQGWSNVGYK